jgi:hypothetical protein
MHAKNFLMLPPDKRLVTKKRAIQNKNNQAVGLNTPFKT